jgi:hypothetical protein
MIRTASIAFTAAWLVAAAITLPAAADTWTGRISDSLCGAKHEAAAEGEDKMPDADCTKACVRGGSTFVFVASNGTIYTIANQEFADLAVRAGREVKLSGDLKDNTITVTRIETP